MRTHCRTLACVVVAAPVVPGCGVLKSIAVPRDFSNFKEFSFGLQGGFGFCPPDDSVARASIKRGTDGTFTLELSIAHQLENGEVDLQEEAPRTLTNDEIDRMTAVFGRIFIHPFRNGLCFVPLPLDTCLTDHFRWDVFETSSFFCAQPRMGNGSAQRIQEFLESLRTESP